MKKCIPIILLLVICLSFSACDAYGLTKNERKAVNTVLKNTDEIMMKDLDSCCLLRDNSSNYYIECRCGKTIKNGYTYYSKEYYYKIDDGALLYVDEGAGFRENHEQCRSSESFGYSYYTSDKLREERLVNAIKELR